MTPSDETSAGPSADGMTQLTELMHDADLPVREQEAFAFDPEREERRRRRRRGGVIAAIVVLVVVALVGAYAGWALTAPVALPSAVTRVPTVAAPDAVDLSLGGPGTWAVSVEGGQEHLGPEASGLWLTVDPDEARSMASVTKLVTALVVLDRRPLEGPDDEGPTLTFHGVQALYDKYYVQNATVARMRPGSTMSQRDVLEMMLVISASNYAEAAARWAYGSTWSFVQAANAWLDENGLDDTRVVEPSGIDPRNTSTASDMVALARLAMADPTIADIVGMASLDVPGFSGSNTNALVRSGVARGIKTGTLDAEGANLLFSATVGVGLAEPLEVTGVVLGGSSQRQNASSVESLLGALRGGFHDVPLGEAGREVGDYETAWGATAKMVTAEAASLFTWSDTPITAELTTTELRRGVAGEKVGTLTWTSGPNSTTVDLVLDRDIELPDAEWRLTHPFELLD